MEMTNPTWIYQGRMITEINDMPEGTYGFIYLTKHIPTGIKYIGKKVLYFERTKKLGKKALEELRLERKAKGIGGRTPLKQKIIKESDWKTYYGSQKEILKLVKESDPKDFTRTILQFEPTMSVSTYL